jgi:hypothetical protein
MRLIPRRLQAAVGLSAIAAFGIVAALPASASAAQSASVHQLTGISGPGATRATSAAAFDQESCNGDVCMILYWNGSSSDFNIFVGANSNAFFGYFHLSGPGGPFSPANTPTEEWAAHGLSGGDYYTWTVSGVPQAGGYCEGAFQDGVSLGKACVTYP